MFCQVGNHDKMGVNAFPLKDLKPEEPKEITLDLLTSLDAPKDEKTHGQIVLELLYKPFDETAANNYSDLNMVEKAPANAPPGGGLLLVIIHEAQDLEGKYHTNPFVRLIFKGEEKKTKVQTNST